MHNFTHLYHKCHIYALYCNTSFQFSKLKQSDSLPSTWQIHRHQVTEDLDNEIEQSNNALKNLDIEAKHKRQLGLLLFDLVNMGDAIFLPSKKDDPKCQAIKMLFKELTLKNGKVRVIPKEATKLIIEVNEYYRSSSSANIQKNENKKTRTLGEAW